MDKYIILYDSDRFVLTDTGMLPFDSTEDALSRLEYFQDKKRLLDAKIYKLVEI